MGGAGVGAATAGGTGGQDLATGVIVVLGGGAPGGGTGAAGGSPSTSSVAGSAGGGSGPIAGGGGTTTGGATSTSPWDPGGPGRDDPSGGTGGTDAPVGGGGAEPSSGAGGTAGGGSGGGPALSGDAAAYVNAHNAVRAAVVEPANYPGTWQPLPPVTWSEQVAASAQEWANHLRDTQNCNLVHDTGSGYGENLAGGWQLSPEVAVELWAEEKETYTYNPRYQFVSGHYTQIVWRDSTTIGCASASCSENQSVIVCRYSPPGNVIGQQPY